MENKVKYFIEIKIDKEWFVLSNKYRGSLAYPFDYMDQALKYVDFYEKAHHLEFDDIRIIEEVTTYNIKSVFSKFE